tara:strand:- start:1266 stop:1874 length:609 start_codon:yes stop_codon:yes gene_type:complete
MAEALKTMTPSKYLNNLNDRLIAVRNNYPDGRKVEHKQAIRDAYISTINDVVGVVESSEKKISALKTQLFLLNIDKTEIPTCLICTEPMKGRVSLGCNHEMCPNCFAQHARLNNNCPFCREEFAPAPKKQTKLPIELLATIADQWASGEYQGSVPQDYFENQRMINLNRTEGGGVEHLRWLVRENGKILMKKVKDWYDKDIN